MADPVTQCNSFGSHHARRTKLPSRVSTTIWVPITTKDGTNTFRGQAIHFIIQYQG